MVYSLGKERKKERKEGRKKEGKVWPQPCHQKRKKIPAV
jgi:hypothetical protein